MHQPILRFWTSTEMKGAIWRTFSKLPQICRVQSFVAHTDFTLASFIWAPIVCAHEDVSRDFKYTRYNLPLYLYNGRNNVNLWYITVSLLVHMCKQDIGMWKVIARTYKGSWSRRWELCYQLHTAIPMTQPSFWGYQIFMKKKRVVYFSQIRTKFWKQRICIPNI